MTEHLKKLPQIQALLRGARISHIVQLYTHNETVQALRAIVSDLRTAALAGTLNQFPDFSGTDFAEDVVQRIEAARAPSLQQVVNATGIIIHTNLGRALMAPAAIEAMKQAAANPTNLEFDLETGKRGSRHHHVERLICALTGAEAAVVVNNCAAAVLLSLVATAAGRSVVASRGELIEIGGAFRLPDVIAQSGATLREVGTTNKTRLSDYEAAIDDATAVLLKSHTSNFRIIGFTSAPARGDLAQLAVEKNVILMEDLGSGILIDLSAYGLGGEPVVSDIIKEGVDLVMFSGDKLLGGPQAGIIAGKRDIIAALKSHPLMRAVRIDKISLAGLEATLRLYRAPFDPLTEIPVLAMLSEPVENVRQRAERLANQLVEMGFTDVTVENAVAQVGAGSLPERGLPSVTVSCQVQGLSAAELTAKLRHHTTPVVGRIERDRVLLDMRTIREGDLAVILAAFQQLPVS